MRIATASRLVGLSSACLLAAALIPACSDGNGGSAADMTPMGKAGGPVMGAADTHCRPGDGGPIVQETNAGACMFKPDMAGEEADGGTGPEEEAPVLFNSEGDDDDCKYHLSFSVTPVYEDTDVTFMVTVTRLSDNGAATDADVDVQAFLNDTHPAPNAPTKTTETSPGHYKIGPVRFDASGRWTVRFHLYETCFDVAEDSPHGHGAFFLDVP